MRFTALTLSDFGVFRGQHTISLSTRQRRPIILFGGKNGAGKTTLLEAVRLCLYGVAAINPRTSKDEYLRYLESRIHYNAQCLIQPTVASVGLEFQYGEVDGLHTYSVTRSWEKRSVNKVIEDLRVERDSKPLDEIAAEHWQDFLRDLVPPGLSQFFFFDGEKIQQLAEDSADQETLAESVKTLLGLDAVERLETDLRIYLSRLVKTTHGRQAARDIEELEGEISRLGRKLSRVHAERKVLGEELAELETAVVRTEEKTASQGGAFARNREDLIRRQADLRARISHIEDAIRQSCAGLLPFALVPSLCGQLREQLLREESAKNLEAARRVLESMKPQIAKHIETHDFWIGLPELPLETRAEIQHRLKRLIEIELAPQEERMEIIHELAEPDQKQVLHWIDQALADIPAAMRAAASELERLYRELHRVEEALRKIPADEVLRPLMEDLRNAHTRLANVAQRVLAKDEEIHSLESELAEIERRRDDAVRKAAAQASQDSKASLVPRVQKVLEEYKGALLAKKISELQASVTECFNRLCRKKDELRKITINPRNFAVTLYDRQDRPLPKSRLSAGEKQIYAISILWALAKTSGRPLPMIIDTPLARLDSDHRKLLVKHYFPAASHQVLILSTDTEVDQSYFTELRPTVAHAYELEFDLAESSTRVKTGYFW